MSHDLDVQCARALGWEMLVNDQPMYFVPDHDRAYLLPPPFSSDRAWAYALENEIERRGLQEQYLVALVGMFGFTDGLDAPVGLDMWLSSNATPSDVFRLLCATPEQRARAFLEAVRRT